MSKKQITQEKIIHSFLTSAAEKSPGATSLADISEILEIKKASLYNHFSSRDEMYSSTLEYCATEILQATFVTSENLTAAANPKTNPQSLLKRVFSQYFKLFESEPFFKMYVFVHSEHYFNRRAMEIAEADFKRLSDEMRSLLKVLKENGKINIDDKDLKDTASLIVSLMINQLDLYIAQKKEIVRQNPDSGVGSLFSLPSDENLLNKYLKPLDFYIRKIVKD